MLGLNIRRECSFHSVNTTFIYTHSSVNDPRRSKARAIHRTRRWSSWRMERR